MRIDRSVMPNTEIKVGELLDVVPTKHPTHVITYKVTEIDEKYVYCEEMN